MRMRFYLGKVLRHRYSYPSLVRLHPLISSSSVGGISQFVVQIPSMDTIFMGYWVAGRLSTMRSIVIYKSKFSIGEMIIMRVLIITFDVFLRGHLSNTTIIALFGSVRVRVDGLGDSL